MFEANIVCIVRSVHDAKLSFPQINFTSAEIRIKQTVNLLHLSN